MKIVYAADNINRANFGCRGTSTALKQLISENNTIVADITGELTHNSGDDNVFFIPNLPVNYKRHGKKGICFKLWRKIARKLNHTSPSKYDFVTENPRQSYQNLIKCLPANKQLEVFDLRQYDFDALVINGEGTMIMSTPCRRDSLVYLMLAQWAVDLGKKVYYVNAMFSDCTVSGKNKKTLKTSEEVFSKCTLVSVRDPYSLEYVKENMPGVNAVFVPDALFTWRKYIDREALRHNINLALPFKKEFDQRLQNVDLTRDYILISGNSLAITNVKMAVDSYTALVNYIKSKTNMQVILLEVCTGDRFLQKVGENTDTPCIPVEIPVLYGLNILANARVYVSGRFHPSIMASLGGTPCVFQGSNSHKTETLGLMLGYESKGAYSAFPDESEFRSIYNDIEEKISLGDELRDKISDNSRKLAQNAEKIKDLLI